MEGPCDDGLQAAQAAEDRAATRAVSSHRNETVRILITQAVDVSSSVERYFQANWHTELSEVIAAFREGKQSLSEDRISLAEHAINLHGRLPHRFVVQREVTSAMLVDVSLQRRSADSYSFMPFTERAMTYLERWIDEHACGESYQWKDGVLHVSGFALARKILEWATEDGFFFETPQGWP